MEADIRYYGFRLRSITVKLAATPCFEQSYLTAESGHRRFGRGEFGCLQAAPARMRPNSWLYLNSDYRGFPLIFPIALSCLLPISRYLFHQRSAGPASLLLQL